MKFETVKLGSLLEVLTDYHANGAYKKLKENVELLDEPDYAVMIRTTNFEKNDFDSSLKYITEHSYNFLSKSKVYGGDIIMNKIANAGSSYLMPELEKPVSLAMNLFLLRVNTEKANPVYVYIYLKIHETYVKNFANGSVTKTITKEAVRSLDIQLPKRNIQNDLVKFYFSLSRKIALNTKTNETLEKLAQALFKSWFVDFDPVKAKAKLKQEGGNLDLIAKELGMSKEILALFPDAMQESELGDIPVGWKVGKLSNLISFNPKRDLKKGTIAPYLDMKNVSTQGHLVKQVILREVASGTKFINGDTLLARITPCLENGKTAYVDFLEKDLVAWGSTEFIVMRSKEGVSTSISYFIARLDSFRNLAIQSMTGTSGRQRANAKALENLPWVIYPEQLLENFGTLSEGFLKSSKIRDNENKVLNQLRDTLLPKLLSGEITINDLESNT